MGVLQKRGSFTVRKELNDNQSDTLDLCAQGSATAYDISYSLVKNISGNSTTGNIKIDDNGNLLNHSYEYESDDFICDVDVTTSVVGGQIQIQFVLNGVGENLVFKAKVNLI